MNLNIETITHDDYYEVIVGGELDVYTVLRVRRSTCAYAPRRKS